MESLILLCVCFLVTGNVFACISSQILALFVKKLVLGFCWKMQKHCVSLSFNQCYRICYSGVFMFLLSLFSTQFLKKLDCQFLFSAFKPYTLKAYGLQFRYQGNEIGPALVMGFGTLMQSNLFF